ncbi:hypothetical protein ECE50_017875 [Chitinophaga sp. Mgbs1]|uniref:Uncharacterized protein n=1 Tax=Chitinophaga solisilvae TaxID=1233460 RepID=A0A3S1D2G1_9BACT|nr:hypothetical protein [Chitinophaga solisilvae]
MRSIFRLSVPVIMLLSACSKSDDNKNTGTPGGGTEGREPVKTGVYTVVNMQADTAANSAGSARTIYYSLEENRIVPAAQAQTASWDIAFTGIYNSSVAPNNGNAANSPGNGGPGKGALLLLRDASIESRYFNDNNNTPKVLPVPKALFDEAFVNVKSVTYPDTDFMTNDYVGLDHFMGTGFGYAFYDFSGALFPGNPKKAHIVYTFPRVILIKTAKGKYAKLQILSVYKDSPANPDRDNKTGYLSFRYAIQMDGSKKLDF